MKLLGLPSVAPLSRVSRVVCVSTFAAAVVSSSASRAQTQSPPPALQVPGAATTAAPITPPPATTAPPAAAPPPPGVPPPAYPGVPPAPGTAPPPGTAAPPTYYPPAPQGGPPPGTQPPPGAAPPGYPPPPPGYAYYSAPPPYRPTVVPPPKSTAGVHLHNGFYLRLGLGVTQASGSIDTPSVGKALTGEYREIGGRANGKISGNGAAFDFAMGGTVYRGLAIAGYASGRSLGDANVRFDTGSTSDRVFNKDFQLASVGVMGDWYIDPRKGLHVQGGVGIASVTHTVESRFDGGPVKDTTARYSGLGLQLGVGYESFVSDDWSIGGLLRIDVANNLTSDTEGNDATPRDTSINVFAPSLLFTGTYN